MPGEAIPVLVVPPVVPNSTTTKLLHFLTAALVLLAVSSGTLTYSYLRVAWQLDRTRAASVAQAKVLASQSASLDELASFATLFAQSLTVTDPAERAAAQAELAKLAQQQRAQQTARNRGTTTTTTSVRATTTTTPSATTTTQPARTCVAGICIGGT